MNKAFEFDLDGTHLQDFGQTVFSQMGLSCLHNLNDVQIQQLDAEAGYSKGEHLELDYLIPMGRTCLVGEITGRRDEGHARKKYQKFRNSYRIVSRLRLTDEVWLQLGVPKERLRDFRDVEDFRGFFIATKLERFDVDLVEVENIACFYRSDWRVLVDYSQTVGSYAKYHFAQRLNLALDATDEWTVRQEDRLLVTKHRLITSGDMGLADLFTFEISPYKLLPVAKVHRRDELPNLSLDPDYQRPLISKKLQDIRERLLGEPDFMFPSPILVVLSNECKFDGKTLIVPKRYGSVSVIDGQHRLFSYADEQLIGIIGETSKIMVTAIMFRDASSEQITRFSAKAFIEINTNQTRVSPTHLDAIAFPILGDTSARALAAQMILRANSATGSLHGLFQTNQTGLGIIRTATVLSSLKAITNLERMRRLQNATKGSALRRKRGYESLFGAPIEALLQPAVLIEKGTVCLVRYFNAVKQVFPNDWPQRGQSLGTSLEFAKVIAGFVKLLWTFVIEGSDWDSVYTELRAIRGSVLELRNMEDHAAVLFDPHDPYIPDYRPSATDDFRFLQANRSKPTPISAVMVLRNSPSPGE